MSEGTGDSRPGYRAIRGDGRWADEPDAPLQDERQVRGSNSREQAIAAAVGNLDKSKYWLAGTAFGVPPEAHNEHARSVVETVLDAAHREGHIHFRDEPTDLPTVEERLEWARVEYRRMVDRMAALEAVLTAARAFCANDLDFATRSRTLWALEDAVRAADALPLTTQRAEGHGDAT